MEETSKTNREPHSLPWRVDGSRILDRNGYEIELDSPEVLTGIVRVINAQRAPEDHG